MISGKEKRLKERRRERYFKRIERNANLQHEFPPSIQRIHASHVTLSKEKG
jgi:hypothetical protein